jgi:hypothetical protein
MFREMYLFAGLLPLILASCTQVAPVDEVCPFGRLTIDERGGIIDEKFEPATEQDERDGKEKIADALLSGKPYSVTIIINAGKIGGSSNTPTKELIMTLVGRPNSEVHHATDDAAWFASSFEVPASHLVPADTSASEAFAIKGTATVEVNSIGDLRTDSDQAMEMVSATWCVG